MRVLSLTLSAVGGVILMLGAACTGGHRFDYGEHGQGSAPSAIGGVPGEGTLERRAIAVESTDSSRLWRGHGVSYGPFRDGQRPGGQLPSREQVREDLHIIASRWSMLRMYGSRGVAETACDIIKEDNLPLRILVGAWITPESRTAADGHVEELKDNAAENLAEAQMAIALANKYPGVVMAVSVGNETLVEWSDHRCDPNLLIKYIRQVRAAVKVPVTTCDDYNFWNKPQSGAVANECDFISTHIYAIWNKQTLLDAMDWTRSTLDTIKSLHPGIPVVITEIGWATSKGTNGYQAIGIVTNPDEREQELFFRSLRDWAAQVHQPYFYFCAFDENWKGGTEPNEVEKNWGVFKADRSPKKVMRP